MSQISTEKIAEICYEVNRAFCQYRGDDTQVSWGEAPEEIKASVIRGVEFTLDNPSTTPELQHGAWVKTKVDQGYVYGAEKDDVKKTHPCIAPYDDLPDFQKFKDKLFITVVKSVM